MPKTHHIINSFNAGELSPLMQARSDQEKYVFGCRTMENFIPLIYGGAQKRPGTEYIAGCKSNSAKSRLVAFEHSVDDTYILEFANQVIRVFRDGAQVVDGVGTETLTAVDSGALVAHWLLNEIEGVTIVNDDNAGTMDGTSSADASVLHATGKVGTGCFDLDGQYNVYMADAAALSFTDNTDDEPFSLACWAYVTQQSGLQVLLSKWDETTGAATMEWQLSLNNERKFQLHLADTSGNLTGDRVAQWKLNEAAANTTVLDDTANNHDGTTQTDDTADLSATGLTNMTPCLDFGGADNVQITNDHVNLSFGDGSDDSAFSIAAWVYVTTSTSSQVILSKHNSTTGAEVREWRFYLGSNEKLYLSLTDESRNGAAHKYTDDALSAGWHFVVATYDGSGGGDADDGITLYVDNVAVAQSGYAISYTAMEDLTVRVRIGARIISTGTAGEYWKDKIDNVVLFDIELTPANISALYNSGAGTEAMTRYEISAVSDDAISIGWHFFAATYSAPDNASATAANGIILYIDGAAVDSTKTNDANYGAMQDGSSLLRIGAQESIAGAAENFWGDKIDEVSIFSDVLTPTEIASLYSTTPYEITAPYLTADLFELKFEHSADVMYITHPDYEPRKLSRLGHTVWTLEALDIRTGPFRPENTDTSFTITPSATTGNITLTAAGTDNNPFVMGTVVGHEPSGSAETSKSQTGALFKLVHATSLSHIAGLLDPTGANSSATFAISNGVTWDLVTNGTWGQAADSATIVLERSYDAGTTYETVVSFTSAANYNIKTSGTEDFADAIYRLTVTETTAGGSACAFNLSVRDTSHIGIVEITSVTSSTTALATVLKTLGSTDLTHRWSEGSFSNYRGWPIDVTISAEERLTFVGNTKQPLNTWGSKTGDFTDFAGGTVDDDAITFALVGTGQQNRMRWVLAKDVLIMGTVGGEHLLGASKDDEALTPTNVRARLQTTHGSEDIAALAINQAILFVQRGGKKIRELLYDFESDSHKADDLTVFANHIMGTDTTDGVVNMAYQRVPDPTLWCVRNDGEIAIMSYERDQKVFAWSRLVTSDSAGDSNFESVAIIYGGARSEDEVWCTVARTINGSTVRYVERFKPKNWGSDDEDAFFVDSGATYDSTATTAMTGATHLAGETVAIYADGAKQANKTVSSTGTFTLDTAASKVQYGLGYTSTLKPMKLDLANLGRATTKKITRGILSLYKTKRGEWGSNIDKLDPIVYRRAGVTTEEFPVFTGDIEMPFRAGYERSGDIIVRQSDPLPMTVLALTLDIGAYND